MKQQAEWKEIPGYPGYYASRDGRIKGKSGRVLKPRKSGSGYLMIATYSNGKRELYIHRAILLAFVGEPEPDQECRHLDGDRTNNHFDNLAWSTHLDNCADRRQHGTDTNGERNGRSKLTEDKVIEIRELYAIGDHTQQELAGQFGISRANVKLIVNGKTWAYLGG